MNLSKSDIEKLLSRHGLLLRGGFRLDPSQDADLLRAFPAARQLLLVGNAGSAIWPHVAAYQQRRPETLHALDQWTEEVLQDVVREAPVVAALFPFGPPPWWPFQRWAQRADTVFPSPVAVLIHPIYGLWHAYRGVLLLAEPVDLPDRVDIASPCDICRDRPCLGACPVGAFSPSGYDVDGCAAHVHGAGGTDCRLGGCLARRACPVGADWRYQPDHMRFHMAAFLRSHP